jgi:ABC-2 type transport system permease protein
MMAPTVRRTLSVARKELIHLLRDPSTLFFALFIPVLQLLMLGYAIDTNVRHIPTLVADQAGTQESRELVRQLENSEDFAVIGRADGDADLRRAIVAGRAKVGLLIPRDFSRRLEAGQTAQWLVLVDGSDSSVAAEAVNVTNAIALRKSLAHILGDRALPIDARPRVLFNPDTRSPNFLLPGLMVVLSQMMAIMLTAGAIVREKERGTLEQLFMTPVRPAELILGKLTPYLLLTFLEFGLIALLMRTLFRVPIHGPFGVLLVVLLPFALAMLGMGLIISTRVSTRDAAMQVAMGTVLPSIFLSGYIFPLNSMPRVFRAIAQAIPATWMIDASRGVILRGAGWGDLWHHAVVLWIMAVVILVVASVRFHKQVT